MKTLIIIDVQNDFMPGGSLAVPQSELIIPIINQLLPKFDLIVATQDWHPQNHQNFASNHTGGKPFEKIRVHGREQTLWPDHCVQGTLGAEFYPQLDTRPIEAIFRKGTDPKIDSYSCFYDNEHKKNTGLAGYLHAKGAKDLYFCGLCADICVFFSIKDAIKEGFQTFLIENATKALNKEQFKKIKVALLDSGVKMM